MGPIWCFSVLVLLAVYQRCTGDDYFNENKQLDPSDTNKDWMKCVPDDKLLSSVTIPGTHQSLKREGLNFYRNFQVWEIPTQLYAGVRFLDMTLWVFFGKLYAENNAAYYYEDFSNALNQLHLFLKDKTSEVVLLRISGTRDAISMVKEKLKHATTDVWTKKTIPKMGEVRGKIVLIQSSDFDWGLPVNAMVLSTEEKELHLKENIKKASEYCTREMMLTDTGAKGQTENPQKVAQTLNKQLGDHLLSLYNTENRRPCLGVFAIDFPSPKLIQQLIKFSCSSGSGPSPKQEINTAPPPDTTTPPPDTTTPPPDTTTPPPDTTTPPPDTTTPPPDTTTPPPDTTTPPPDTTTPPPDTTTPPPDTTTPPPDTTTPPPDTTTPPPDTTTPPPDTTTPPPDTTTPPPDTTTPPPDTTTPPPDTTTPPPDTTTPPPDTTTPPPDTTTPPPDTTTPPPDTTTPPPDTTTPPPDTTTPPPDTTTPPPDTTTPPPDTTTPPPDTTTPTPPSDTTTPPPDTTTPPPDTTTPTPPPDTTTPPPDTTTPPPDTTTPPPDTTTPPPDTTTPTPPPDTTTSPPDTTTPPLDTTMPPPSIPQTSSPPTKPHRKLHRVCHRVQRRKPSPLVS